jgi:hypothetical protein
MGVVSRPPPLPGGPTRQDAAVHLLRSARRAVFSLVAQFFRPNAQFSRPRPRHDLATTHRRSLAAAPRRRGELALPSSLPFPILSLPHHGPSLQPLVAPFFFPDETSPCRCPALRPGGPARGCSPAARHLASATCATCLAPASSPPQPHLDAPAVHPAASTYVALCRCHGYPAGTRADVAAAPHFAGEPRPCTSRPSRCALAARPAPRHG